MVIINNAADNGLAYVDGSYSEKIFCPDSSIADGMSQCGYNSAEKEKKRFSKNMHFILTDINGRNYYDGQLKILHQDGEDLGGRKQWDQGTVVNYICNIGFSKGGDGDIIESYRINKTFNLSTGHDLEANEVYKSLLGKLELIFTNFYAKNPQGVTIGDMWDNMIFNRSSGSSYETFLSSLLVKGTGDLFQEINSSMQFGGFVDDDEDLERKSDNITDGENAPRFGAMGDRPSGFRPVLLNFLSNVNRLEKGKTTNSQNCSGYISPNDVLMITTVNDHRGGSSSKSRKSRKNIRNITHKRKSSHKKRATRKRIVYKNKSKKNKH